MKKILFLLLISIASYGQADFPEGINLGGNTATAETSKLVSQQPTTGELNYVNATALPVSTPTQQALDMKLNISDLPTNLTLYPTTTASDVGGYVVMVTDIYDVRYDEPAVDVSTPTITTTAQLVSSRISDAGVLVGQPGVFNVTAFGNIRRLSGTGTATFYFEVYHRDLAGTETLIGQSSNSEAVSSATYMEFTASLVWDDGDFISTDRIVVKTYANRIPGNSDPVYQFQFGGAQPVRILLPVPFSVVDAGYEVKTNKSDSYTASSSTTYASTKALVDGLASIVPEEYTTIVFVNSTNPNTATIFDTVNPPVTNDNGLKNDVANLYIGTDASTWVYDTALFGYVTKSIPAVSNFFISGSSTDAGNDKTNPIYRNGTVESTGFIKTSGTASQFLKADGSSDSTAYSSLTVVPIETGTSFSLDNTYTGKIVIFTSSCTLTIPNGLQAGFNATFVTLAGVTLTVSTGGSVVLFNNVGTTMLEKSSFTLQARTTTNNYITAGAL